MTAFLLDVNVLIALSWPDHTLHLPARKWFARNGSKGWATCPLVQTGFVRIVSNPAFSSRAVSVQEAVEALYASLQDKAHQFWPDSISVAQAAALLAGMGGGHQRVSDAYLVALAIQNRGKLATLDRGIERFAPAGSLEVIT